MGFGNNYDIFFKLFANNKIDCIFEIGSRDCLDSIKMFKKFNPSRVFAFECNPKQIQVCLKNIKKYPKIHLIERAIYDKDNEELSFTIPTNYGLDGGQGSLCGKVRHEYWEKTNHTFGKKKESSLKSSIIQVSTIRLDTFCEEHNIDIIDLICLDVEGLPLKCIKSLSDRIQKVKFIISEVYFKNVFPNCDLFEEMVQYMGQHGFTLKKIIKKNEWMGDALWVNNLFFDQN